MLRSGLLVLLLVALCASGALAYSGSLSWATPGVQHTSPDYWTFGCFSGTGMWVDKDLCPCEGDLWAHPTLDWIVTQNTNGTWHYDYTLTVYRGEILSFLVETSPNFTSSNLLNPKVNGVNWSIKTSVGTNSTLVYSNMPMNLYGIAFSVLSGLTTNVTFDSPKGPRWGDFYASDGDLGGDLNTLWNTGFNNPDTDPSVAPHDGGEHCSVLVPDTVVPEPASLLSLAVGLTGLIGIAVRKRR